jgi:Mg-chelatase subunit ChlD
MAENTSEVSKESKLDLGKKISYVCLSILVIELFSPFIAFVLDCTGSMGSYIQHAKDNINKIVDEIRKSEKCHVQVGLVEYRDHPPQDPTFTTKVNQFNDDIVKVKDFVSNCCAAGGGDFPESICCGLGDCLNKLNWRDNAVHIAILIGDAPPHGIHGVNGDSFPNGCPAKNDPVKIANEMAEKAITLYTAGCEPSMKPYRKFFMALSLITGGKYVPIDDAECLSDVRILIRI